MGQVRGLPQPRGHHPSSWPPGSRRGACLGSAAGEALASSPATTKTFLVHGNGQTGWLDHESAHPERTDPDDAALFDGIDRKAGGCLVAYGWVMAENLVKLGARGL